MIKKLLKLVILAAVVGGVVAWGYYAVMNRQLNINNWFVGNMVRGVDVSSYQEDVDMVSLLNQGVHFVYIKATEGSDHVDPSFQEKWERAIDAKIPAGAYHYFSYNCSGTEQAENFIETVGELEKGQNFLIPVVDMELTPDEVMNPPEKDVVVKGLKAFSSIVEEKYGVKPMIYSRKDYFDKYLADDFSGYQRFVTNVFWPVWIDVADSWVMWQYNDCGKMSGYHGEECIDLDALNPKYSIDDLKIK